MKQPNGISRPRDDREKHVNRQEEPERGGGEGVYARDADQGDVYTIENYR